MNKIMGLDLSLKSSGLSILDEYGRDTTSAFQTSTKLSTERRIALIKEFVLSSLDGVKDVFIEGYAFHGSSLAVLAELSGVIKNAMLTGGINFYTVAPTTVKKYITGSGKADKDVMRLAVYKRFGKEFKTTDECDAYAIADFGYNVLFPPIRKLTKQEKEVIDKYMKDNGVIL